jgi:hypothetical protein
MPGSIRARSSSTVSIFGQPKPTSGTAGARKTSLFGKVIDAPPELRNEIEKVSIDADRNPTIGNLTEPSEATGAETCQILSGRPTRLS